MGRHIGLVGPKHSGKTTAGEFLVERMGYKKIALADPLKDHAVAMINTFNTRVGLPEIDRQFMADHKDEVFVPFLQWLGTDYGRVFLKTPDRWINAFLDQSYSSVDPVVCDDIRFPNEADALSDNGFLIVRLIRDPSDRLESLLRAGVNPDVHGHASETELSNIKPDLIVRVDGGIDVLNASMLWCVTFQQAVQEFFRMQAQVPYFHYTDVQLAESIELIRSLQESRSLVQIQIEDPVYAHVWNTFEDLTNV